MCPPPTPDSEPALPDAHTVADEADRVARLERRLAREREARKEAERLLESKSRELYEANRSLQALTRDLEQRVEERTSEVQRLMDAERAREEQLRHAHKMEALGLLAGGVAHDFNNLLTVIGGASQLLQMEPALSPFQELFGEIIGASNRAGALTSQLLAFSRRRTTEPQRFCAAGAVRDVQHLLRRLLTERIDLRLEIGDATSTFDLFMDRGGFDQILLNLAANARDAMPEGGWFLVRLTKALMDERTAAAMHVPAGDYARLDVVDCGTGMDAEVAKRAFDPFFTTKPLGAGSGLGLANVYAIVRQAGGHVAIDSTPGAGTTIRVLVPVAPLDAPRSTASEPAPRTLEGPVTVLVVDDEPGVRTVASLSLRKRGFHVLEAGSGEQALDVVKNTQAPIDVMLSDVRMPGMNGYELAMCMQGARPSTACILMSGYVDEEHLRDRIVTAGLPLIEKPFTSGTLVDAIHRVLSGHSKEKAL